MMIKQFTFDGKHEKILELLPWQVNGTLLAEQSKEVQAHVNTCLICQREMEFLKRAFDADAALTDSDTINHGLDIEDGLAKVMKRIENYEQTRMETKPSPKSHPLSKLGLKHLLERLNIIRFFNSRLFNNPPYWAGAIAASLFVAVLSFQLINQRDGDLSAPNTPLVEQTGEYQVLISERDGVSPVRIKVGFSQSMAPAQARALIAATGVKFKLYPQQEHSYIIELLPDQKMQAQKALLDFLAKDKDVIAVDIIVDE